MLRTFGCCGMAILGLVGVAHATSAHHGRVFPINAQPSLADLFPQKPVEFPKGVKAYRDVTYAARIGFRPQIVDIYVPAAAGRHPLVIYIHAGGWRVGHTRHSGAFADWPSVLATLSSEGFTVASVEYRLSSEAPFPAQLQDVNAALRFLRAHADTYRIDGDRVALWGGSAGGHLAALAAVACGNTLLDPAAAQDKCAQAAVTWYGAYDFAGMDATPDFQSTARQLLDCAEGCPDERKRQASPISYVNSRSPPFLIIQGQDDKVFPAAQARAAETALKAAGVLVHTIYFPGADHSFVGKTPADTRRNSLVAINATFNFFHERLGVPTP